MNVASGEGRALTLTDLAVLIGGRVLGDGSVAVGDVSPLRDANPGDLALFAVRKYLPQVAETRASALLVSEELAAAVPQGRSAVAVADPHRALVQLLAHFHPPHVARPDVHATAVLGRGVVLGENVTISPYVVVESGSRVGDGVQLGPHVCIGRDCVIGDHAVLHPHVVLYAGTTLGARVILHAGARVGVDGFGYVFTEGRHEKVPQVGGCVIEDDVEIGANACIDRGSIGTTRLGAGTKLDNLVHVAHNVQIGERCLLVAQVGIAGSTRVGPGAVFGGQSGASNHLEIGAGVQIAAQAGVTNDVAAGEVMMGFPARPRREFLRGQAALARLPRLRSELLARRKDAPAEDG